MGTGAVPRGGWAVGRIQLALGRGSDLLHGFDFGSRRSVQPFVGVDPDFADAAFEDAFQIFGIGQQKAVTPKRMLLPGPSQLLDPHPQFQRLDAYAFQHGQFLPLPE
jgi:hypothetical protein